tara:strand:- start:2468 stop:3580 length:1113 start_codon:yes stop_codon:yes gene_type:complete
LKVDTWDYLDYFLYYDYWTRLGHHKSLHSRQENLSKLLNLLIEKKIKIFLDKKSVFNTLVNETYNLEADAEYLVIYKDSKNILLRIIHENNYEIIHQDTNQVKLHVNLRLIVIRFINKKYFVPKVKKIKILNCEIEYFQKYRIQYYFIERLLQIFRKIFLKIRSKYFLLRKKLNKYILKKNMGLHVIESEKIYKIELKAFLNLNIENKNSPSWIVRKRHLDFVTNNKKNLKVKDIIYYLSKGDNLETLMNKAQVTKLEKSISGSISHSKYFWNSGNNYFLFSIFYQFRKGVVPYKRANEYLNKKYNVNLYSREYFQLLEPMNDNEIESFLRDNLIEITDNHISSGKHRVFAMIGRLIEGKDYIPFYTRIY